MEDCLTLESLVRETTAYSNRVIGLGLWTPRIVPWIKLPSTDWLGDGHEPGRPSAQMEAGISIGDLSLTLTRTEARDLADKLEAAILAGNRVVPFVHQGTFHSVPAVPAALASVRQVSEELDKRTVGISASSEAPTPAPEDFASSEPEAPIVTLIRTNEGAVEFEGLVSPRQHSPFGTPSSIRSTLKPHQCEGLDWLQKAWSFGNPGVLLADDMGLGKTLQGLAFMAWLREGMACGKMPRRPILIVAPTGLLANWLKEHDLHLRAPGLGICLEAYGAGLKPLKRQHVSGRAGLDTSRLESADWVLTTYETLRDYIADFAAVRFAALMFDEAQKIKNPGVRMTDAAKSAQADFIIALTGTPVENRLADLWCITDTVHPAILGDLKSFSKTYEGAPDTGQTAQLRATLDSWRGARPPLMLRRMKRDKLPDLPEEREYLRPSPMPAQQFAAYAAAIAEARDAEEAGAMLKALQALRRISLHPSIDMHGNDAAFISASARLTKAFEALDVISRSGERTLIFLEERAMQARLVGILQRRYALPQPPMLITGEVAGSKRQERVDAFQSAPDGFDVMILSPKAGGVGLTLTRANHVIHLSRWWNPAVEDQCTARAMRIGQTRPVSIHIPLATLPDGRRSFDENLDALLTRKRQLSRDALMPSERPAEDTQELFRATVG